VAAFEDRLLDEDVTMREIVVAIAGALEGDRAN
jgi:hypothetical protein